jgi:NADH-quinone oxidoreductase subunit G
VLDAVGSNIRVDTYGWEVKRILPRLNNEINEEWISDKTRYSCDGLLKQRLDTPYIKKNNKLVKSSWDEAIKLVSEKIKNTVPEMIAGHIGDIVSLESSLAFKKFLKNFKIKNIDFREKKFYINSEEKINYIFNSSIQGIEDSDLILLVGCNPRHEATILNARIRKAYKNGTKIYSIGDPGDLTYEYEIIGESTKDIQNLVENKSEITKKILSAKKPIIIIGESALETNNGKYIFEEIKVFLLENELISDEWNALNILIQNASTVGAIDLGLMNFDDKNNFIFFDKLENNQFKLLYLLGSDNLDIKKNNEFIIYQGSHGDKGAAIADVIFPSPAYTEQDGLYSNLEGRVQECRKASYPTGQALEDWKIFNLILKELNQSIIFKDSKSLRTEIYNLLPNFSSIGMLHKKVAIKHKKKETNFNDHKIKINKIDYFYTNAISRSSKTMSECRRVQNEELKNGTNN